MNYNVNLQVFQKILVTEFNVPKNDIYLTCGKYKNTEKEQLTKEQQDEYERHMNEKTST